MLICLQTFPIISHNLAKKVVKDAIGCHLLLDTHLHRSVQGCCCIQGLLWRTRGNLLGVTIPSLMGYSHFRTARCCWQKRQRQLLSKLLVCCFVCMTLVAEHYESIRITCDQLRIMHRNNVHEKKKNETSK